MSDESQLPVEAAPDAPADANRAPQPPKPSYPFSVLKVLSSSLRITQHNFAPFFLLACVLEIPALLVMFGGVKDHVLLAFVVQLVVGAFTQAVVAYGVIMELQGSRPSTRACITMGAAQLSRVLGVTVVSSLAIGGAMLLLVVPGIIVALMYYVVVPVTLAEGLGVRAAMRRSRELTYGRKGDICLILMLASALGILLEVYGYRQLGHDAAIVARALGSAVSSMFFAVTVAVTYFELRKVREGIDVPELATAFAHIRK